MIHDSTLGNNILERGTEKFIMYWLVWSSGKGMTFLSTAGPPWSWIPIFIDSTNHWSQLYSPPPKKKNVSKKQHLNSLHITYTVLDTISNLDKQRDPIDRPRNQNWVSCIVGGFFFFTICTHETHGNIFNNPWKNIMEKNMRKNVFMCIYV